MIATPPFFARFFPKLGPIPPSIGSLLVNTSSDNNFPAAFRRAPPPPPPSPPSATTFFVSHLFLLLLLLPSRRPFSLLPPHPHARTASTYVRRAGTCVISHYVRPRVGPRIYGLCIYTRYSWYIYRVSHSGTEIFSKTIDTTFFFSSTTLSSLSLFLHFFNSTDAGRVIPSILFLFFFPKCRFTRINKSFSRDGTICIKRTRNSNIFLF